MHRFVQRADLQRTDVHRGRRPRTEAGDGHQDVDDSGRVATSGRQAACASRVIGTESDRGRIG
jgi:hypothetical protein